jgi:hypothetical protein
MLATVDSQSRGPILKKETLFEVRSAPLPTEKVPRVVEPTSFKLNSMGMFDAGRVSIGASIPDSHVGRGEDLVIHLACRNNSRFNIRNVSVTYVKRCNGALAPAANRE